jgi:hypothetical protein
MLVRAYDHTGDKRPMHHLEDGDLIDWKRNGATGFQRARVVAAINNHDKVKIRPADATTNNPTGERERWIKLPSIMYVFDSKGVRKSPAQVE